MGGLELEEGKRGIWKCMGNKNKVSQVLIGNGKYVRENACCKIPPRSATNVRR